jgi:cytochrome c oxidase subunit 1
MAELALGRQHAMAESAGMRQFAWLWGGLFLVLFPLLGLLGVFMRMYQAGWLQELVPDPHWFYAAMTLHGLGLVGLIYAASFVALLWAVSPHVQLQTRWLWISTGLTAVGVVLLVVNFFNGFAPGWYFLYPLPFMPSGAWSGTATDIFLAAVAVLGVAWVIWELELLRAIAARYRLGVALGWQYLRKGEPRPEIPPVVLVATVCAIAGIVALLAAVVMLVLMLVHRFSGSMVDPLVVKNLTFFFGHTLVNLAMYHGIGFLYSTLPKYSGQPWKTGIPLVVAWNLVLLLVLTAYFHHLYMDFAQPRWVNFVGQFASYGVSIPAAVVTLLGTLSQVYRRPVRWTLASSLMFWGTMGWAIGGVAAVLDSTIAFNFRFHNTLWVPAHFHTYLLAGIVFITLGFVAHLAQELSGKSESAGMRRTILALLLIGGYGFVLMFYLSGANGVPRRYAIYPPDAELGVQLARIATFFVALVVLGVLLYLVTVGKQWGAALAGAQGSSASD